jgi:hypothetical protein
MKNLITTFIVSVVVLAGFVYLFPDTAGKSVSNFGSVNIANGYRSTTTDSTWNAAFNKDIDECTTVLGSVVITNATAGSAFNIYDATSTTDLSEKLIASFGATTPAGTYVFDRDLTRGLVADMLSANIASTTITCR